ncbi:MAG: hypothetical protein ACM3PY_09455 [Omnitrophica WOR_2 bacterium]
MRIPQKIRVIARGGRTALKPIRNVQHHLEYLVNKTGKELHFESVAIQLLKIETDATVEESGLSK